MFGYLLSYYGVKAYPLLTPLIGLLAFFLIALFILGELKSIDENTTKTNDQRFLVSIGIILAVSWDALWSGPAKSAQVVSWSPMAIWLSFLVVGATVATLSTFAYWLAKRIASSSFTHWQHNTAALNLLQWLQLSAISYFGWLALIRYTFGWTLPSPLVLLVSLVFMLLLMYMPKFKYAIPKLS